ncbi:MBL fold metallo-hydrolase [Clostridium sp. MCC353]|uniref:MBL fold metallo-hydrolase n=1 Tax=Clostridium sp. MCC353 TaxID=2592646 RepID=UPI001C016EED|nr:MBL fold metallo-hydrolase [Clostridium sp. MCC353]MBT9777504.1 MBL fold metallo-hydrolase [Clostridium sp. MCC353]
MNRGIKIRWIYAACYEIKLPNGITIVTDPFITPKVPAGEFCLDQMEGADYILLTHTHYDHISDLKELTLRFHSKIVGGSIAMRELIRVFDLPFDSMYPVNAGETLIFPEFRLEVSRARHNLLNKPELPASDLCGASKRIYGVDGFDEIQAYGYIESLDFMITCSDNTRIMMASGISALLNGFQTAKEKAPNILLRQTANQQPPEEYGQMLSKYHAAVTLPFHHENLERKGGWVLSEYMDQAGQALRKINPASVLLNPEPYRWYQIGYEIL